MSILVTNIKTLDYVLEYNNRNSDGFKTIDNSSKTQVSEETTMAKFRVNSDADAKVYQSLTAKLQ
jgi:Fe(3+) dicitrate transport protein